MQRNNDTHSKNGNPREEKLRNLHEDLDELGVLQYLQSADAINEPNVGEIFPMAEKTSLEDLEKFLIPEEKISLEDAEAYLIPEAKISLEDLEAYLIPEAKTSFEDLEAYLIPEPTLAKKPRLDKSSVEANASQKTSASDSSQNFSQLFQPAPALPPPTSSDHHSRNFLRVDQRWLITDMTALPRDFSNCNYFCGAMRSVFSNHKHWWPLRITQDKNMISISGEMLVNPLEATEGPIKRLKEKIRNIASRNNVKVTRIKAKKIESEPQKQVNPINTPQPNTTIPQMASLPNGSLFNQSGKPIIKASEYTAKINQSGDTTTKKTSQRKTS